MKILQGTDNSSFHENVASSKCSLGSFPAVKAYLAFCILSGVALISKLAQYPFVVRPISLKDSIRKNQSNENMRALQNSDDESLITIDINLGARGDHIYQSPYLKAGLEQSVKDYLNQLVECNNVGVDEPDEEEKAKPIFYSIQLDGNNEDQKLKKSRDVCEGYEYNDTSQSENRTTCTRNYIRCRGADRRTCKERVFSWAAVMNKMNNDVSGSEGLKLNEFETRWSSSCEEKSIFEYFQEKIVSASRFNYNVDIEILSDLTFELDFNVNFTPEIGFGLNQIDSLNVKVEEPVSVTTVCTKLECETQTATIKHIFADLEIPYDAEKHECLQQGINCNSENLVTYIWLANKKLNGTITESIGNLPSLRGLFLGGNELSGTIPNGFGLLRRLELLWLEENDLTGTIPSSLGNQRGLLELNLFGNRLSGTIPPRIGQRNRLQMLHLGNNELQGSIFNLFDAIPEKVNANSNNDCMNFPNIFTFLGFTGDSFRATVQNNRKSKFDEDISDLQLLSLYGNRLTGSLPSKLFDRSKLVNLNLANNGFTGNLLNEIGRFSSLKVFDIYNNDFSGTIPSEFGRLRNLEVINLLNNNFKGTIPNTIGNLPKISELILEENGLTGSIPSQIGFLTKLKSMSLHKTNLNGTIPTELVNLNSLTTLNIDLTRFSFGSTKLPTYLGHINGLKVVDLSNGGFEGPIPTEFSQFRFCEVINLNNNALTGSIPSEMSALMSLELLGLDTNELTGTIPTDLGSIHSLTYLLLSSNQISGTIPSELGLTDLKKLVLDNNDLTGDIPRELGDVIISYTGNNVSTFAPTMSPAPSINGTLAPTSCTIANVTYPNIAPNTTTLTRPSTLCPVYARNLGVHSTVQECAETAKTDTSCTGHEIMWDDDNGGCFCCRELYTINCPFDQHFYWAAFTWDLYQYSNPPQQPMCCQ